MESTRRFSAVCRFLGRAVLAGLAGRAPFTGRWVRAGPPAGTGQPVLAVEALMEFGVVLVLPAEHVHVLVPKPVGHLDVVIPRINESGVGAPMPAEVGVEPGKLRLHLVPQEVP